MFSWKRLDLGPRDLGGGGGGVAKSEVIFQHIFVQAVFPISKIVSFAETNNSMTIIIGGSKGGTRDVRAPIGPISFIFMQFLLQNQGLAHPSRKSWIQLSNRNEKGFCIDCFSPFSL